MRRWLTPEQDAWQRLFDPGFWWRAPMRFLTISNAHPQIYGHPYSKVAELLFLMRSH